MGLAKRMQEEQWDQGWSYSDKSVCSSCVNDEHLAAAIDREADEAKPCDFCDQTPAADLNVLLAAFVAGLRNVYGTADNEGVPYDSSEGGYQLPTIDTWDIVHTELGHVFMSEDLMEAVMESMDMRIWIERDWAWRKRDQVLIGSWQEFCETVKYKTRFVVWLKDDYTVDGQWQTGEIPAALILSEIGKLIDQIDALTVDLPAGHGLYRARAHEHSQRLTSASQLGTAPRDYASANRMSPAGIGMFYGAERPDTAIAEVAIHAAPGDARVSIGRFTTNQPMKVIDFSRLPTNVNMFHPTLGHIYQQMKFLENFVEELGRPATDRQHIDYVPTQIITEYLLQVYGAELHVTGIFYASAVDRNVCAVLDVDNAQCRDEDSDIDDNNLLLILREVEERPLAEDLT